MPTRTASARWEGTVQEGSGTMKVGSGAFEGAYAFATRMGDEPGTNPEELIGAAHAGCFSMFLAGVLGKAGSPPEKIETDATVTFEQLDSGWTITKIELKSRGTVPGIDDAGFKDAAENAKLNCPVSKALTGVDVVLDAALA